MESVYLNIMGIEGDTPEIEKQRSIAKEANVDWMIFRREASEEVQLLTWTGVVKINRK